MSHSRIGPADLAACRDLLAEGSKTFSLASRLLPATVRDRATVLYAFCRVSDDRVDTDPNATSSTIDFMRARLDAAYRGSPGDDAVERSFAALLSDVEIPKALPLALLEGMEWDVVGRRYESLDALHAYAARVAGTVGAMMTLLMGVSGSEVIARACDLGVAMQLTNIARDVGEDARRGRIYLPTSWLRDEGVDPDAWLRNPVPDRAIRAVVARLLDHADSLYRRADHGVTLLPRTCRLAIRAARLVYSDIGRAIAAAGFDSVTRRARVSAWRKVYLVFRAFSATLYSPAALDEPPLEATQALVAACGRPG